MSETTPAASIRNAVRPAAPASSMRAGRSSAISADASPPTSTSTSSPAPTTERSGTVRAAAETATTGALPGGRPEIVVPAANVTTARPSAESTKSPAAGNDPPSADRSIDGEAPETLRTSVPAARCTGAVPAALTAPDGAAMARPSIADPGFPAASSYDPAATPSIVPPAPGAKISLSRTTRREAPDPATDTADAGAELPVEDADTDAKSARSTPDTASSNTMVNEEAFAAEADSADGDCPSATGTALAPANSYRAEPMPPLPASLPMSSAPVASGAAGGGSNRRVWDAPPEPPTEAMARGAPSIARE